MKRYDDVWIYRPVSGEPYVHMEHSFAEAEESIMECAEPNHLVELYHVSLDGLMCEYVGRFMTGKGRV